MDDKRKPVRRLSKKEADERAVSIASAYLAANPHDKWQGTCIGVSPVAGNEALRCVCVLWTEGDATIDGPSLLIVNLETDHAEFGRG